MTPSARSRNIAVLGLGFTSLIWGGSFAAVAYILHRGIKVEALLSLRFSIGALALGLLVLAQRIALKKRDLLDGLYLGLVVATLFWLQTDGLRFTTTAKSGFITGLYVIFTPMVSMLVGDKLKGSHALAAGMALLGLLMLVYQPGAGMSGWNRGDTETLLNAILVGFHIVMTGRFSRRSNGWILAWVQVSVVAVVMTAFALLTQGFSGLNVPLHRLDVWSALLYLGLLATTVAFWLQSTLQARVGATESAILFSMEPAFAAVIAVIGIIPGVKEQLSPFQIMGAAVIVSAALIVELGPRLLNRGKPDLEALG
jgi:drug/metabolite transporter (DMT)-like permease